MRDEYDEKHGIMKGNNIAYRERERRGGGIKREREQETISNNRSISFALF